MTTVNPKAFPLANAQLTQQILDLVQQGNLPFPFPNRVQILTFSLSLQDAQEGCQRDDKDIEPWN
jgi:hypothetical protein